MAEPRSYYLLALTLWTLVSILAVQAQAQDCSPAPVKLPILNVTIAPDIVRRGVSMKVGQPEQELSFLPHWGSNNTLIFGPECPEGGRDAGCVTFRGGLYDPDNSDSDGEVDSDYESAPESYPSDSYRIFTENLTLSDNLAVEDFPLGSILDIEGWGLESYTPQHFLGLLPGSVLLDTLHQRNLISSRSWGMHWGLDGRSDDAQSEGSLVLGGYDKAKTYGDGFTRGLEKREECASGIVVTIQDLVLNMANGTDVSLFSLETSGGQSIMACIMPSIPVFMQIPRDPYFERWEEALGYTLESGIDRSSGVDFWNLLLSAEDDDRGYNGDVTLDFGSNFKLKFSNEQLVVPERTIDDDGVVVANGSQPVLRVNPLQSETAGSFPILGRYFLTEAYLACHQETQQFTIWQANPTTTSEDLTAFDEEFNNIDPDSICTGSDGEGDGTDESDGNGGSSGGGRLSTGAIAGVVVAAAVSLAAVAAGVWWWRRQKPAGVQNAPETAGNVQSPQNEYKGPSPVYYPSYIPQELPGQDRPKTQEPSEMAA